jgi:Mn2+/Fe2+ NRAMP family transporter
MRVDTLTAMAVYTVATVAFYVLGASVLFGIGEVPVGYDMVGTLSRMYTETFGPGAFYLFLAGAFFVLYSTVFSATASNSRVLVDFFQLTGAFRITDEKRRKFWIRAMVASLLTLCAALYLLVGEPVYMVVFGGIAQACMLPIIGFSTLYLRYRRLEAALRPGVVTDVLLWLCSTLMLSFALYAVAARLIG